MMKPKEYLAAAANARAVYTLLYEMSLMTLPPSPAVECNVECHYTVRDLAVKLDGRTPSIIRNELKWLVNWGWILNLKGSTRYLGRRIDGVLHLMADVAAFDATGEHRLVSREILGITIEAPAVTSESVKRGAARVWRGKDIKSGGDLDLGA